MPATPERIRKIRAELRARGICTRCHKRPAGEGRLICRTCCSATARHKVKLRVKWREDGVLCIGCGVKNDRPHRSKCRRCKKKATECQQNIRDKRRNEGLCRNCGREIPEEMSSYTSCPHCYQRDLNASFMRKGTVHG